MATSYLPCLGVLCTFKSQACYIRRGDLGRIGAISGGLLRLGLLVSAISILPLFYVKFLLYLYYSGGDATSSYNPQVFKHLV